MKTSVTTFEIPVAVPYVWSLGGPVNLEFVVRVLRVQLKRSVVSCIYLQMSALSKVQSMVDIWVPGLGEGVAAFKENDINHDNKQPS